MSADDLRAVAKEIREKANAAVCGPWTIDEDNYLAVASVRMPYAYVKPKDRDWFDVNTPDNATAYHIAAWHPAVALAVADWLDEIARQLGFVNDGARVDLRFVARAEAFVRAWRGES